jgi:Helix-loop-helix DNA-binding domain
MLSPIQHITTAATPMFIDSPPPSSRPVLPPLDSFDPTLRRGSITDPATHASNRSSLTNGHRGYSSHYPNLSSRAPSFRDDRPLTPDTSDRRSLDSDSHGNERHYSIGLVEPVSHLSLSRRSSISGWSRHNGEPRITHFHVDSTTSLGSSSTTASSRVPPSATREQYLSDHNGSPHNRASPHHAPPISTTAPGTIAERYPQSRTFPYPHPNAPHPTKGYPYAFPDPSYDEPSPPSSARPPPLHYQRSLPSIHPQHEQAIREVDMGLAPYSRSPELRQSHKLAERKRRSEMKNMFDELKAHIPMDSTLKTSKWETLSRGMRFCTAG